MANNKKYIIVLVLLIFIGLGIFTFAAPAGDNEGGNNISNNIVLGGDDSSDTNTTTNETANTTTNNTTTTNTTVTRPANGNNGQNGGTQENNGAGNEQKPETIINEALAKAEEAVKKAEDNLTEEDYKNAIGFVGELSEEEIGNLNDRLSAVKNVLDVIELVENLEKQTNDAENKNEMVAAKKYREDNGVTKKVEDLKSDALVDEELQGELSETLAQLALLLDDNNGPEFNIEDGAILNSLSKIKVEDKEKNEIVSLKLIDANQNEADVTEGLTVVDGTYKMVAMDKAFNEGVVTFVIDSIAAEKVSANMYANGVLKETEEGNKVYKDYYVGNGNTITAYVRLSEQLKELPTFTFNIAGEDYVVENVTESFHNDSDKANGIYKYQVTLSVAAEDKYLDGEVDFIVSNIIDKAGNPSEDIKGVTNLNSVFIDRNASKLSLNGSKELTLEAGVDTYTEEGITVTDEVDGTFTYSEVSYMTYRPFGGNASKVTKVDMMKPGMYKIVYKYTDNAGNVGVDANRADHDYVMRTVYVKDTIGAKLTLNGSKEITLEAGVDTYTELGITAVDTIDGTVTVMDVDYMTYRPFGGNASKVTKVDMMKPGMYKIVYRYTDNAGNAGTDANRDDHDYVMRTVYVKDIIGASLTLNGEKEITLEAGVDTYVEQGATAVDIIDGTVSIMDADYITYRPFGGNASKVDSVDMTKPGMYKIVFKYTDNAGNPGVDASRDDHDYVMRTVYVKDTTAPTLNITNWIDLTLEAGSTYVDEGATASDIIDGNLTSKITVSYLYYDEEGIRITPDPTEIKLDKVGQFVIKYVVRDNAGNKTEKTRRINVIDTTAPRLTLNGSKELTLEAGIDTYTEEGITVTDIVDGTFTYTEVDYMTYRPFGGAASTVTAVDMLKPGMYKIVYKYTDKAGNIGLDASRDDHDYVMRTVYVKDTTAPRLTLNGSKELTLEAGIDTYTEEGITVTDEVDGTFTYSEIAYMTYRPFGGNASSVTEIDMKKTGMYKIVYKYTDKAGNIGLDASRDDHDYVMRIVYVKDTTAADIELPFTEGLNKNEMHVNSGATVTLDDLLALVSDNVDLPTTIKPYRADLLISNIASENTYNYDFNSLGFKTNYKGRYNLYYEYIDDAGNKSEATMLLIMSDVTAPTVRFTKLNKYLKVDEIQPVEIDGKLYFNQPVTVSFGDNVNIETMGHNDYHYVEGNIKRTGWTRNATTLGEHTVYVIDSSGNKTSVTFTIVENPELELVNNTLNISEDMTLIETGLYYDATSSGDKGQIIAESGDIVIKGNNKTVTMKAANREAYMEWETGYKSPTMTNVFASKNGSVTVNDLTLTGQMTTNTMGYYATTHGKNVFNNVKIVNAEVVSYSQIAAGLIVYGEAELNNTSVYGTKMSSMDEAGFPLYDLAAVNGTNVTINGGKYGSVYTWQGAKMTFTNSEVDSILTLADQWLGRGHLVIGEGTTVKNLVVSPLTASNPANGFFPSVTIKAGATVEVLDLSNTEYDSYVVIEPGAIVNTIIN